MFSIRVVGLCKPGWRKSSSPFNGLCKVTQVANICGKALRQGRPPKPPPFDYKNKEYGWWAVFFDPMEARFDENTRLVVIEGLPGAGKDKFAKKLAAELEMHYQPPASFKDVNINKYGFDLTTMNDRLPIDAQYFDETHFLKDPTGRNSVAVQQAFYLMRYEKYIDSINHLFATGEGVVLQRSPWADIAFGKAMFQNNYIPKRGYDYLLTSRDRSLGNLLRPHLVIYLDIPPKVAKERIEKRGRPFEADSKALSLKFLEDIERNYKEKHLPEISKHAHVLTYDWTEEGNVEYVVDDIEKMKFEDYERDEGKMYDWDFATWDYRRARRGMYANEKFQLLQDAKVLRLDCPEMFISGADVETLRELEHKLGETVPGLEYDEGYDPMVEKGLLWKRGDWK